MCPNKDVGGGSGEDVDLDLGHIFLISLTPGTLHVCITSMYPCTQEVKLLHSSGIYCVTVSVNIDSVMLKSDFSPKYGHLFLMQCALSVRELAFCLWAITALTLLMRN